MRGTDLFIYSNSLQVSKLSYSPKCQTISTDIRIQKYCFSCVLIFSFLEMTVYTDDRNSNTLLTVLELNSDPPTCSRGRALLAESLLWTLWGGDQHRNTPVVHTDTHLRLKSETQLRTTSVKRLNHLNLLEDFDLTFTHLIQSLFYPQAKMTQWNF